jgi:hypothetical protein
MRRVSYAERLRREAALSVTNLITSESEPEKWLVGWSPMPSYRHVSEQGRSMVMMNGIDRWHTMKEAHGVRGFRRREKQ